VGFNAFLDVFDTGGGCEQKDTCEVAPEIGWDEAFHDEN
jgi:hypothetical protein